MNEYQTICKFCNNDVSFEERIRFLLEHIKEASDGRQP